MLSCLSHYTNKSYTSLSQGKYDTPCGMLLWSLFITGAHGGELPDKLILNSHYKVKLERCRKR